MKDKSREKDPHFHESKVYKKHGEKDFGVRENNISLKGDADMNDVFVPIKCSQEEIETVLFIQSAVPKIKQFLKCLREGDTDTLNLPFLIGI